MPSEAKRYTNPLDDGRRKIPKDKYKEVKAVYQSLHSFQKTADHFSVSKRTIIFIVNPQSLKTLQERNKRNQHWKRYYDKEERKMAMRKYRVKKRLAGLMIAPPRKKINL